MSIDPATELSFEAPGVPPVAGGKRVSAGVSPGRLALRRLGRNKVACAFGVLFLVMVAVSLAAPLWADHVAKTTASENHITDRITVDGEQKDVVSPQGVPIGPTWQSEFFLGADGNGRDIMVRLLYGGRNSLWIGVLAASFTVFFSVVVGLVAGYFRGWTDAVIARVLDVIWAFPVVLLGVALGTALALGGLQAGAREGGGRLASGSPCW